MMPKKAVKPSYSLTPVAFYTALFGLNTLLFAICDTALRVERAITQNQNMIGSVYIPALEYVLTGLVVLCGGVLLIDYVARR